MTIELKNQNEKRRNSQSEKQSGTFKEISTNEKYILETIDKLLDRKLESVAEKLGKSVMNELKKSNKNIDDKLKEVINENKSYAETVKGSMDNKENKTNTVPDIRSILDEAKNDQLIEEKDRAARAKNIIIYGLEEKGDDANAKKTHDELMTRLFLERINVQVTPLNTFRLGKPDPNKTRPLKLEMANTSDKDRIMQNLKRLKGTEKELGKLNIKDDYTNKEREQIRNFVDIAKAKNMEDNDPSHHWVIRGSPKNGIRLVRLTRQ